MAKAKKEKKETAPKTVEVKTSGNPKSVIDKVLAEGKAKVVGSSAIKNPNYSGKPKEGKTSEVAALFAKAEAEIAAEEAKKPVVKLVKASITFPEIPGMTQVAPKTTDELAVVLAAQMLKGKKVLALLDEEVGKFTQVQLVFVNTTFKKKDAVMNRIILVDLDGVDPIKGQFKGGVFSQPKREGAECEGFKGRIQFYVEA